MTMRRFALITGLAASTLAFGGTAAFADTVNISGSVANYSNISSTATAGASSLNLAGVGTASTDVVVQVADIVITSNNAEGVSLQASADSALTGGTNGDSITYNVKLSDEGVTPSAGAITATSDTVNVSSFSSNTADQDLYIKYDGPQYLDPGTYSSSITMTVQSYL